MTDHAQLQTLAKRHLLMHFTRHSAYETDEVPVISHGEHCSVYDTNGKKYFDALSGLFCTQIGYSFGAELGEAAAKQMAELPFYTNSGVKQRLKRNLEHNYLLRVKMKNLVSS